jgi:AraC-like DNA-binding protein
VDAATAGYRVGYDDPSHFSREYKRLFGEPPMRDVERLRGAAAGSVLNATRPRTVRHLSGASDELLQKGRSA